MAAARGGVARVGADAEAAQPAAFFARFVRARRPCVVAGLPRDLAGMAAWSDDRLRELAGAAEVQVEVGAAADGAARFGKGRKQRMTFAQVLDRLADRDGSLYLTAQEPATDAKSGLRHLSAAPVRDLLEQGEAPLRPALLGNLVPAHVNVWMGSSPDGTCTGLHHDYHDNLYVLLRGRKRFQLFPPTDAPYLYTRGDIERIHPNGRINYKGFATDADGSEPALRAARMAAIARRAAEQELEAAEAAAAEGAAGAADRLRAAELALDAAMDSALDAVDADDFDDISCDDEDDSDDSGSDKEDDDDDSGGAADSRRGKSASGPQTPATKRSRDAISATSDPKRARAGTNDEDDDDGGSDQGDPYETPLNFSCIDLTKPVDTDAFPLFRKATGVECELRAGEMLYMPAGWFHCVTSCNDPAEDRDPAQFGGHLAFNYWMHPPDADDFAQPYKSTFWPDDWAARQQPGAPRS